MFANDLTLASTTSTGARRSPSTAQSRLSAHYDPYSYMRMKNSRSGRESIRFDAVKIKLFADAQPPFSYLQQIRDTTPFWSRHFHSDRPKLEHSHAFAQRDSGLGPHSRGRGAVRKSRVSRRAISLCDICLLLFLHPFQP